MKPPKENDPLSELMAKLKECNPEIQNYVTALKSENLKLQRHIAKLQAEEVSLLNRIKILEDEYPKKQEVMFKVVHDNLPNDKNE